MRAHALSLDLSNRAESFLESSKCRTHPLETSRYRLWLTHWGTSLYIIPNSELVVQINSKNVCGENLTTRKLLVRCATFFLCLSVTLSIAHHRCCLALAQTTSPFGLISNIITFFLKPQSMLRVSLSLCLSVSVFLYQYPSLYLSLSLCPSISLCPSLFI